jgi:hypothetical protein
MDLREQNQTTLNRHPWELSRLKFISKKLNKYKKHTNISLIDIGCGDAFVVKKLSETIIFDEIFAVDIEFSAEDLKILNDQKKIQYTNDIKNVNVKEKNIIVILLLDVVEHIENENEFLKNILDAQFCKNETYLYITVPSYNALFSSHDNFLLHFRRYKNKDLINLVVKNNLHTIENGYFFISLLIPRIISVIFEKVFKSKRKTSTQLSSWNYSETHPLTRIIMLFLEFDLKFTNIFKFFRINIPGLSNYVVCKKSV